MATSVVTAVPIAVKLLSGTDATSINEIIDIVSLIPFDQVECDACGQTDPTTKCKRCRCAYYCGNDECQSDHWKKHQETCVDFAPLACKHLEPVRRIPSGRNMKCGLCPKVGNDLDLPVVLECKHAFCLTCLKRNRCENRTDDSRSSNNTATPIFCCCPTCNEEIPMVLKPSIDVETIPICLAEQYVNVAKRKDTKETEKSDLIRSAILELQKVVRGYRISSAAHSAASAEFSMTELWATVPREKAFTAHMRIAELFLQLGDTESLWKELRAVLQDETKLQMDVLLRTIGELTVGDDPLKRTGTYIMFRFIISIFFVYVSVCARQPL